MFTRFGFRRLLIVAAVVLGAAGASSASASCFWYVPGGCTYAQINGGQSGGWQGVSGLMTRAHNNTGGSRQLGIWQYPIAGSPGLVRKYNVTFSAWQDIGFALNSGTQALLINNGAYWANAYGYMG